MSGGSGGGGGGGSNYTFRSTPTGQGNWNTGGVITGHGSMESGIRGTSPQYSRAPSGYGGESPAQMAALTSIWQQLLGGSVGFGGPGILGNIGGGQPPGVPITALPAKDQSRILPGNKKYYDRVPATNWRPSSWDNAAYEAQINRGMR